MTRVKIHDFHIDHDNTKIVKYSAYFALVINSKGDCSQEIKKRLRLRMAAKEELGQLTKNRDEPLQTKANIIHTHIFPITIYRCKNWTAKKTYMKKKKDLFEIWYWSRSLWIQWNTRMTNK